MKRVVYDARTGVGLTLTPFTKGGQPVYASIKMISDPEDPTHQYVEELTPDSHEAFKVMRFLDEMNGIGWTPELKRLEKELRLALLDLATADVKAENK